MRRIGSLLIAAVLVTAGSRGARAQPDTPTQPAQPGDDTPADPYGGGADLPDESPEATDPTPPAEPAPPTPAKPKPPEPPIKMPQIFQAPTGHLLAAGLIYSRTGLDTGGGLSSDLRVGLGDVAEFGVEMTDLIRARNDADADTERVFPFITATFKMGLTEDRLFRNQPAMSLGFRKSFEREEANRTMRIAELYFVGSKSLGNAASIHAGGTFWDASVQTIGSEAVLLHDRGVSKQLRAFGGLEVRPKDDAQIMLELLWVPEFRYSDNITKLRPLFSWGVRYEVADWIMLESGVRIPNIDDVNLIDAQIFGQLKFVSRRLRRAIDQLR